MLTESTRELEMTLYKIEPIEDNIDTVSLLYYCTPLTTSLTEVVLQIRPPGCEPVVLRWKMACGNSLGKQ